MIVLDASAAAELLLATDAGALVAARISDGDDSLHAPELIGAELASVLRRLMLREELHQDQAQRVVVELAALGIETYPHVLFMGRVLELRANLTSYDAFYVALAEVLDAPLLTCDAKLAQAIGHGARIDVVG